jgi:hypothetical protein
LIGGIKTWCRLNQVSKSIEQSPLLSTRSAHVLVMETLWYGLVTMTDALQLFGDPGSTNLQLVARAENLNATNKRVLTRSGLAQGSLSSGADTVGCHVRPGSDIHPDIEALTEDRYLLFLPAAEAVEFLPGLSSNPVSRASFLSPQSLPDLIPRFPSALAPPLRVVVSAWMLLIRMDRAYLHTAIGIKSSTMPQRDSDRTLRLDRSSVCRLQLPHHCCCHPCWLSSQSVIG